MSVVDFSLKAAFATALAGFTAYTGFAAYQGLSYAFELASGPVDGFVASAAGTALASVAAMTGLGMRDVIIDAVEDLKHTVSCVSADLRYCLRRS